MAGLYIHIPFCKKACAYCNFHFNTNFKTKPEVVQSIVDELKLRKHEIGNILESVYFGGGTPSILTKEELTFIMTEIRNNFDLSACKEITFEVNPDDATLENLDFWFGLGINRLSMGVQSFFEADLKYMGRFHKAEEAIQAIENLHKSKFDNYSIDLIYGSPTLTDDMWRENLEFARKNNIPHISSYALTVEPDTKLSYRIQKTKQKHPLDNDAVRQFKILQDWAIKNGYDHYEISNLAKKGKKAVHNSNYWTGKPYLGLGPSAHSFFGNSRKWNVANNRKYSESIAQNLVAYESEELSQADAYNEMLMISLRTKEGLDLNRFYKAFGVSGKNRLQKDLNSIPSHYYELNEYFLKLKPEFWMLSDGIISDLFWVED